ncbi:hypothetical protein CKO23_19145 [Thiocystis violacea]|nr:hypothetical protein [Thiocystis violacea]
MEEWRRHAYLEAMGVTLWELRSGGAIQPPLVACDEPAPALAVDQEGGGVERPNAQDAAAQGAEVQARASVESEAVNQQAPPAPAQDTPEPPPWPDVAPWPDDVWAADAELDLWSNTIGEDQQGGVEQMDWPALQAAVVGCRACGLCETRTQTVFGVGNQEADLMIVGEAPGADEDRAGEPFVGRAGQLLNRMLAAIGLPREQVYIANVLKCRPPGNRDPKPEEALQCEAFLLRQMELVRPRLILSVGRISAQHLLRTDTSVGRLRGRWFDFGAHAVPLRVTYHPAYLLRSPEQKAKAWDDLTEIRRRLDAPRTPGQGAG